jgi:hypothetical protein
MGGICSLIDPIPMQEDRVIFVALVHNCRPLSLFAESLHRINFMITRRSWWSLGQLRYESTLLRFPALVAGRSLPGALRSPKPWSDVKHVGPIPPAQKRPRGGVHPPAFPDSWVGVIGSAGEEAVSEA